MRASLICVVLTLLLSSPAWAEQPALRLCSEDWPPYEFAVSGKPKGLAYDVISSVLDTMEIPIESYTEVTWIRGLESIRTGRMDVLYSALKTPEREQFAYYPDEPIAESKWVLFTLASRANNVKYASLDDLEGKSVGIVRGYSYPKEFLDTAKELGTVEARVLSVDNFKKLVSGRLDYVIEEMLVGLHLMDRIGARGVVIPIEKAVIAVKPVYAMFSKTTVSGDFVNRFSKELKRFRKSSQHRKLVESYRQPE